MYTNNDFRLYHSWGKKPEQKAAEKAYNQKYYKEHPEKWKKEKAKVYTKETNWRGDRIPVDYEDINNHWDKGAKRLSEKYGVNYGHLTLADPKILEIGIKELQKDNYRMAYDNYARKIAIEYMKYPIEHLRDKVRR